MTPLPISVGHALNQLFTSNIETDIWGLNIDQCLIATDTERMPKVACGNTAVEKVIGPFTNKMHINGLSISKLNLKSI